MAVCSIASQGHRVAWHRIILVRLYVSISASIQPGINERGSRPLQEAARWLMLLQINSVLLLQRSADGVQTEYRAHWQEFPVQLQLQCSSTGRRNGHQTRALHRTHLPLQVQFQYSARYVLCSGVSRQEVRTSRSPGKYGVGPGGWIHGASQQFHLASASSVPISSTFF